MPASAQDAGVDSYCDAPLFKKAFHFYSDRGYDASTAFDMAKDKYFNTSSDPTAIEAAMAEMNDEMPDYDKWRAKKDKQAKKHVGKKLTKRPKQSAAGSSEDKQLVLYKGDQ